MTAIANPPSLLYTVPYLTVDEYKRAPTGVDLKGLVPGATPAQRDAELANVIARASGLVNRIAMQNLAATVDTEVGRIRLSRDGEIFVQTQCWPIVEIRALSLGPTPSQETAQALDNVMIEKSAFTAVLSSLGLTTSSGPLQLPGVSPSQRAFASWTYVNGWPCTTLKATCLAGATTIQVVDNTGCHAGTQLVVYDADLQETVTVTAEPTDTTHLAVSATAHAHATTGISVSSLPPAVKEAAILATSALVKLRGNQALVMRTINSSEPEAQKDDKPGVGDLKNAMWILSPYKAVR